MHPSSTLDTPIPCSGARLPPAFCDPGKPTSARQKERRTRPPRMDYKRRRSHSPGEYKEGCDKDYESSERNHNSRNLDDSSNARPVRGYESRQSDRPSYGTSRESRRHDDDRRYHDKHAGDYGRSHSRSSRSDHEPRAGTYYERSKRDGTERVRGDQRDTDSRYSVKSFNRELRSKDDGKQASPRHYRRYDGGEYDRCTNAKKLVEKKDYYRASDKDKEIEEEVVKKRNGKEIEKEAEVETREKKRNLFSSSVPNFDFSEDARLSSATSANESLDGVNAAKIAAMKAAELVNRNIATFGAGTGRLTTDQKKKLLWGNKKSNPSEETSKRWDLNLFSDLERQEKFNKLMSLRMPWWLWPFAGCQEHCTSSGEQGWKQGWELVRSQETGGAGHQPGEALHSRPSPERWPDGWPWSVGNNAWCVGVFECLLCTMLSGLFILAPGSLTVCFMLVLAHKQQCCHELCSLLLQPNCSYFRVHSYLDRQNVTRYP